MALHLKSQTPSIPLSERGMQVRPPLRKRDEIVPPPSGKGGQGGFEPTEWENHP